MLESHEPKAAASQLAAAVAGVIEDADEAGWVLRHLGALVGLETGETLFGGCAGPRPSRRGGASSSGSPRGDRRCSFSRIFTGPTTRCSTSSNTCSPGPPTSSCSYCAPRGRSCSSDAPAGARTPGRRTLSRSRHCPIRRHTSSSTHSSGRRSCRRRCARRCSGAPRATLCMRRSSFACSRTVECSWVERVSGPWSARTTFRCPTRCWESSLRAWMRSRWKTRR